MQLNKLHLACGKNILNGWNNYDFEPINGAKKIDLLKPLPFIENSIEYIYFEHALEHFDEVDGFVLLEQFFKILKPSGVVRIVTPNLDTYIDRYMNWNSEENYARMQQFNDQTQFLNYAFFGESINNNIKFLNNMISTEIGHKFLYSKSNLCFKLEKIGFNIKICSYNFSEHNVLNKIETRPDYKDLIIEATKNV
jgi:predicted SAM-dependent methyltransferase